MSANKVKVTMQVVVNINYVEDTEKAGFLSSIT